MAPGSGWAIDEVSRRHGDFALAGAAAVVTLDGRGQVARAAIGLVSLHDRAVRAVHAERLLTGEHPTDAAIHAAAEAAGRLDAEPDVRPPRVERLSAPFGRRARATRT